jgi:hypothetical protein
MLLNVLCLEIVDDVFTLSLSIVYLFFDRDVTVYTSSRSLHV